MIAVKDLAYVRYGAPDLDVMERFLVDFGLQRSARTECALYMRACCDLPFVHVTEKTEANREIGFGLLAQGHDDLISIANTLGTPVHDNPEPGGGLRVRCFDPAGFRVDILYGQASVGLLPRRDPIELNAAVGRRRYGKTVRVSPTPSAVMRLGHIGLMVPDFASSLAFYRDLLGMKPSDDYFAGPPTNVVASFMHCGLGATYTDHHTIAVITARDGVARFDHSAFEVVDLDDVMQGNQYLKSKGYRHSWGVGRHVQGSQIFDYWRDPYGNKIEHWTDGDLVNDDSPTGLAPMSETELWQWAPPLLPEFFQPAGADEEHREPQA
jgi:catechol 2,3-dioxygenase-like lactoylglutathione lyase family enzyme